MRWSRNGKKGHFLVSSRGYLCSFKGCIVDVVGELGRSTFAGWSFSEWVRMMGKLWFGRIDVEMEVYREVDLQKWTYESEEVGDGSES